MPHEPMQDAIDIATKVVSEEGYMHADDKAVMLAAMGHVARTFTEANEQTRKEMNSGFVRLEEKFERGCDEPKTKRRQTMERLKLPGLVAVLVAIMEAVRQLMAG